MSSSGKSTSPYSGRWVAQLHGQVIAQGGTPEQALHAAQGSRFKESPEIVFMPVFPPLNLPPLLVPIRAALPEGKPVYLVGGAVRDLLLGRTTHDLDFTLSRGAISAARRVANALRADFYPLDTGRDTGRVIVTGADGTRTLLDFASFRGEDLASDLLGRDFTLDAIAMDIRTLAIYDPLGGAQDLLEKRLRQCSPTSLWDDPLRVLRAIRIAATFNFHILPETRQALKKAAKLLPEVSPERVRDELFRILEGPQPAASLRALELLGALAPILPELPALKGILQPAPHVSDAWTHTLATLAHLETILNALSPSYNPHTVSDLFNGLLVMRLGRYRHQLAEYFSAALNINRSLRGLLFFAALYHDIAKPLRSSAGEDGRLRFWAHEEEGAQLVARRGRFLQLSNDEVTHLRLIVQNHMRVLNLLHQQLDEGRSPSRRAIFRFFRDTGESGVDVCLLALADLRATYEQTLPQEMWGAALDIVRLLLENWWEKQPECITPPPLLNGNDLMSELHLQPGSLIGDLLEAIREAQAVGEVVTREDALAAAKKRLEEGL